MAKGQKPDRGDLAENEGGNMMTHTFDTTLYERKHGKEPQGKRVWEFVPADHIWRDYIQPVNGVKWNGTYSEAKSVIAQRYPKMKEWKVLA